MTAGPLSPTLRELRGVVRQRQRADRDRRRVTVAGQHLADPVERVERAGESGVDRGVLDQRAQLVRGDVVLQGRLQVDPQLRVGASERGEDCDGGDLAIAPGAAAGRPAAG